MRNLATPALAAALLLAAGRAPAAPLPPRPNVVVIMVDDLGYGDLGVYGQQRIATPELDAMAAEGLRFTDFYSGAPHCPPARNALLAGVHTGHTHVRNEEPLTAAAPLLPQLLHAAGYVTGMFGKWGMSALDAADAPVVADPAALGFDAFAGHLTHRDAHVYYLDSPGQPPGTPQHPYYGNVRQHLFEIRDGRTVPLHLPPDRYVHGELVERTLRFLDEHAPASAERPFFLYLPYTLPHAELAAPAADEAQYLDAAGRSVFPETAWTPPLDGAGFDRHNPHPRATYAAMVSRLSRDVGRILARLRAHGVAERTLVIFTSDNGPHDAGGIVSPAFFASAGGLSGMKWSLREGGIRVPTIAWWPGAIAPGVTAEPAALWDVLPTVADLAGLPPPPGTDGVSLRPLLMGSGALPERALYWETWNGRADYRQAARIGRYKALRRVGDGGVELYDVVADPAETVDLAGDPARCAELLALEEVFLTARERPPNAPGDRYVLPPLPLRCAPGGACRADAEAVCLQGGRFAVEVAWHDFFGRGGRGRVVGTPSAESVLFWFLDADNWEVLAKVIDGCGTNDRVWVFAAATTNLGYTLRVTDVAAGERRIYVNPLGTASPAFTDAAAFAACGG